MRLSAKGAMRTRQESKRVMGFSKAWKSGDTLTVFYPTFQELDPVTNKMETDLLVASVWGHNVGLKELGLKRVFIPSNSELVDGRPTVQDALYQFSRIARLFVQGQKDAKVNQILSNDKISEAIRRTSLNKIDEEFENVTPVVGPLRNVISTECVVVPMVNDAPQMDKVAIYSQDLSDARITALFGIISNRQFYKPEHGKWVEVTYTFGNTNDKKVDGKVSPQGVTKEYSLETRFPDDFKAIMATLESLPETSETIRKRNSNYVPMEESKIIAGINNYAAMNVSDLENITDADSLQLLKDRAEVIVNLQIPIKNFDDYKALVGETDDTVTGVIDGKGITVDRKEAPNMANLIENQDIINAQLARQEESGEDDLEPLADVDFSNLGELA